MKTLEPPPEVPVRLVGGLSPASGRLEVFRDAIWGTVCRDFIDETDATLVCKQLGFPGLLSIEGIEAYGQGDFGMPIWAEMRCTGTELSVEECTWGDNLGVTGCNHTKDTGIKCQTGRFNFIT